MLSLLTFRRVEVHQESPSYSCKINSTIISVASACLIRSREYHSPGENTHARALFKVVSFLGERERKKWNIIKGGRVLKVIEWCMSSILSVRLWTRDLSHGGETN